MLVWKIQSTFFLKKFKTFRWLKILEFLKLIFVTFYIQEVLFAFVFNCKCVILALHLSLSTWGLRLPTKTLDFFGVWWPNALAKPFSKLAINMNFDIKTTSKYWIRWWWLFLFWTQNSLFGQIWSKWIKSCLFKIKLAGWTNSNMLNSMVMIICLPLD